MTDNTTNKLFAVHDIKRMATLPTVGIPADAADDAPC